MVLAKEEVLDCEYMVMLNGKSISQKLSSSSSEAGSLAKLQAVGEVRIRYEVLYVEVDVVDDAQEEEDEDELVMAGLDDELVDDMVELKLLVVVADLLLLPAAL